jgi:hypothetical protein
MANFKKIFIIIFLFLLFAISGFLIYKKGGKTFSTKGQGGNLLKPKEVVKTPSPFSGIDCSNAKGRAFGVIIAQYSETMPLSGISEAEVVIEWPVANAGGVTRLLAIFQCQNPKEIGSIRSGRPYIAEIAKGFDVIFSSWGGPDVLVQKINQIGLDWLNAMQNPSGAFFRKKNKPSPHNGFSSLEKLKKAALDKKMRMENNFEGYQFLKENEVIYKKVDQIINVSYSPPVKYIYDFQSGNYFRYWNNIEAVDQNTGNKAYAKNVILMKTTIGVLKTGIADAKVVGKGEAKIYQGGEEINGTWSKESASSKLFFFNDKGEEIRFIPGPIWIEIVDKF